MSIKIMAQVWEREFSRSEQAIMLALADHAHDDGSRVFPSVARTAWKTGYSKRQVQRIIGQLRKSHVLTVIKKAYKNRPTEYKIDLSKAKDKPPYRSDTMSPPDPPEVTNETGGGDISSSRGDIVASPKPSLETSKESIEEPTCPQEWMDAICKACHMDIAAVSTGTLKNVSTCGKKLISLGATIGDLRKFYTWHMSDPWRKEHETLTPKKIQDRWGQHDGQNEGLANGTKPKLEVYR